MIKNTITFILSIFTFLFFAEVVLRIFFPIPFEASHIYNKKYIQNHPGLKNEINLFTNKFGFRSVSMKTKKKPPNTIRILCLGASTTQMIRQNFNDTWYGLIENRLNEEFKSTNIKIEVAAFGRGGIKTKELYFWIKANLDRYEPDIVITLLGINDLSWNGGPGYKYNGLNFQRIKRSDQMSIRHLCKSKLQLCRRMAVAKARIITMWNLSFGDAVSWDSKNLPTLRNTYQSYPYYETIYRNPDPIIEFKDSMEAITKFMKSRNIELLLLGQPVIWKKKMNKEDYKLLWFYVNTHNGPVRPSTKWLADEMTKYNNVQKEVASKNDFVFIDLDKKIPKTGEYYIDDCHYTDSGSRKISDLIYPAVRNIISKFI